MKWLFGLLLALGLLACAVALGPGCAHWHEDWEAKCGPQVDPLLKPCSCFDRRTPTCPPPPSDAKKPCSATSPLARACPPGSAYYGSLDGRTGCFDAEWKWLGPANPPPCPFKETKGTP